MRVNRSMPAAAIIPVVEYPDVPAAMKWLEEAFGFEIRLRIAAHRAQLQIHLPRSGGPLLDVFRDNRQRRPRRLGRRVSVEQPDLTSNSLRTSRGPFKCTAPKRGGNVRRAHLGGARRSGRAAVRR
jgi:hypothetical protein